MSFSLSPVNILWPDDAVAPMLNLMPSIGDVMFLQRIEPPMILDRLHKIFAVTPALWLTVFLSYVVRASLALGRLPKPYRPDPKDLGFDFHYDVIFLSAIPVAATLIAFPCVKEMMKRRDCRSSRMADFFFVLSWGVLVMFVVLDPMSFVEWFLD